MRHGYSTMRLRLWLIPVLLLVACSDEEAEESGTMADAAALVSLRQEPKFEPSGFYVGADTPEDGVQLVALVNGAIDDVAAMPRPLDPDKVRRRLTRLNDDVDFFATEDREMTYRYAVRIWRAAGFTGESELFGVPDERILSLP